MTFRLESRNRLRVDAATGLRAFNGPMSSPAPRREEGDMAWLEQMLGDGDDDAENDDYVDDDDDDDDDDRASRSTRKSSKKPRPRPCEDEEECRGGGGVDEEGGKARKKRKGKGGGNKKIRACGFEALYPTKEKKKEKWSNCAKLT